MRRSMPGFALALLFAVRIAVAAAPPAVVEAVQMPAWIERGEDAPFRVNQALSFYIAPKDKPALPVAPVDPAQLRQWAAETEIAAGAGATRRGGKWKVIAASVGTQAEALEVYDALRAAGYAADIQPGMAHGQRNYDVRLSQLPSRREAEALAASIRGRFGADEPRVGR